MRLDNQVVLVTGGSGGLGEQICYEAAKEGAIVIVCARRIQEIERVKEECMKLSQRPAYAYQLDSSSSDSILSVVEKIKEEIGKVTILVNNAGFGYFEDFLSFDPALARDMFEVNVFGLMLMTQLIAKEMLVNQSGHIINIASIAAKIATPKSSIYSATKFAVLGFSDALRLELKPFRIFVTTVNPGPIKTNFFDRADPSGTYLKNLDLFILDPQKLARKIVRQMNRPKREINSPVTFELGAQMYHLFPAIGDFLAGGILNKK